MHMNALTNNTTFDFCFSDFDMKIPTKNENELDFIPAHLNVLSLLIEWILRNSIGFNLVAFLKIVEK